MKNETRDRKVTKIWVAYHEARILVAPGALNLIYQLFKEECDSAQVRFMGMTDEARLKWLREVMG